MNISFEQLNKEGYQLGYIQVNNEEVFRATMLSLAHVLGTPIQSRSRGPIIDVLRPQLKRDANPRSLSANHELGDFPFHTDAAYKPLPCRYLVMGCANPGPTNRPTKLLDSHCLNLTSEDRAVLKSAPFQIRNGRRSFFATIFSDSEIVRFDEGCMYPTLESSRRALALFKSKMDSAHWDPINWKFGEVLIIDNWRMLHGRGKPADNTDDSSRTLLRISIQ